MLLTASKVYVRHPELDLAKINRDFILKQVCDAVNTISDVAQGKSSQPTEIYSGCGELAAALDDFDVILFQFLISTFLLNFSMYYKDVLFCLFLIYNIGRYYNGSNDLQ